MLRCCATLPGGFMPKTRSIALFGCFAIALSLTIVVPKLRAQDALTSVDFPGATETDCNDINTNGTVVGFYADSSGIDHGFTLKGGTFTALNFPRSQSTLAYGINT